MNDILRGLKILLIAAVVLLVGLVALTLVGAVVGLAWEFLCRVVPIVLVCAVALAAIVGCFGWMRGLISLPMRKWRRMAGDFALLAICFFCFLAMRSCA